MDLSPDVGSENERIDERLSEIETQSSEQAESIAVALDEHKAALAEQQTQFAELVDKKTYELQDELAPLREAASEADSIIEQQKTRLDTALSSHQEKFSSAQDDRTEKWTSLLADNESKLQEHLTAMREHEEQSRKVQSAVGVNATATDYGAYANAQKEAANRWRIGAVIALSIAAVAFLVVAGAPLFGFGGNSEWWEVVLQKLGATGAAHPHSARAVHRQPAGEAERTYPRRDRTADLRRAAGRISGSRRRCPGRRSRGERVGRLVTTSVAKPLPTSGGVNKRATCRKLRLDCPGRNGSRGKTIYERRLLAERMLIR
jgi:hypothetical protein